MAPRCGGGRTPSEFKFQLENTHVIGPHQIWAGVVPTGPSKVVMNASYKTRGSNEYRNELGNAIGAPWLRRGQRGGAPDHAPFCAVSSHGHQ